MAGRDPHAALLKAARKITQNLDRDRLADRAAAVRGSVTPMSERISNAALRDLCDAVAAFDKPAALP